MARKKQAQKIIRKRTNENGVDEYLVRWKNLPVFSSTWKSVDELDHHELKLAEEFEANRLEDILGVKKIDGEINYLVKLKNETAPQIIHSAELKTLWPMTFIHFLEASLVWVKNPVNEQFNQDGEETTDPIGKPLRVVYVTDVTGELMYCFQWQEGYKFLTSEEAKKSWPELIVDYLESKLSFE